MAQFYYEGELNSGREFSFDEKESAHLKVFRVRKGEKIKVFSPWGRYIVEVFDFKNKKVFARAVEKIEEEKQNLKVKLYFSFIEKQAFEEVLRKGTEIGCDIFVPTICEFTQKNHILNVEEKIERFNEIIFSAVKQSERSTIPQIAPVVNFSDIFSIEKNPIIFSKTDANKKPSLSPLKMHISDEIALVIGPEGGFSEKELDMAREKGIFVSLGQNILRTQTAAVLACAITRIIKG